MAGGPDGCVAAAIEAARSRWRSLRRRLRFDTGSAPREVVGPVSYQGMAREPRGSPVGDAFAWASQIIAIGLTMFLPGVAGGWLDERLGTRWIGPAGFVVGFAGALAWLTSLRPGRGRP